MSIRNVPRSLNWTGGISDLRNFSTTSDTPAKSILDLLTTGEDRGNDADLVLKHLCRGWWIIQWLSEISDWPGMARFLRALRAACCTVTFPSSTCLSNSSRSFCTIPVSTMWMQFPSVHKKRKMYSQSEHSDHTILHVLVGLRSYHCGQS